MKFNADLMISVNGIRFNSDPYILPSFAPFAREDPSHSGMTNDACSDQGIEFPDAWMFPQQCVVFLIGMAIFLVRAMFFIVFYCPPSLRPVRDEQPGQGGLSVSVLSRPIIGLSQCWQKQ